jgi:hypothetical protein
MRTDQNCPLPKAKPVTAVNITDLAYRSLASKDEVSSYRYGPLRPELVGPMVHQFGTPKVDPAITKVASSDGECVFVPG